MKKSLVIWYFHPFACSSSRGVGKPNRAYFLAKAWREAGHEPYVISASYEHLSGEKSDKLSQPGFELHKDGEINFIWVKSRRYRGNGLGRILNSLDYARQIHKNADSFSQISGVPDIIICSSPHPFHFNASLKLAKKYQAKIISEIRDLWPLSLIEILGVKSFHPLCLWLAHIEKRMCRHSDALVSLLNNADKHLAQLGLNKSKFHCITNGYSIMPSAHNAVEVQRDPDYQKILNMRSQDKFIIGYTGAMGRPNYLDVLCAAVSQLAEKNIELVLVGDGEVKLSLIEKYKNANNLHFFPVKSKSVIASYQQLFHLGYNGRECLDMWRYGLSPNKMYEYMYNSLPVIFPSFPDDTPVHEAGCGILFDNRHEPILALKEAILTASGQPRNKLKKMGEKGKALVEKKYTYDALANDYLELMLKL